MSAVLEPRTNIPSIELQIADRKIRGYEQTAQSRRDQNDGKEFEPLLEQGIHAFQWLEKAEAVLMEAIALGVDLDIAKFETAIEALYRAWLTPGELVQERIKRFGANGIEIPSGREFESCLDRAADWIERNENYKLAKATREERVAQDLD